MQSKIIYVGQEELFNNFLVDKEIVIIADSNTNGFCIAEASKLMIPLSKARIITIPAGEAFKNIESVQWIWQQLQEFGVNKSWCIVTIGGGVLSDVANFAAATYMRGIDFVSIPTTLLAMTDASIGGKTGFNFGGIKNAIGVFAEPKMVYINPIFLKTLSEKNCWNGAAESIKHALLHDKNTWEKYYKIPGLDKFISLQSIKLSNECKQYFVQQDFFDVGIRQALNFGHSIGHAIEACSAQTKKPMLHGEAVMLGMIAELYISEKLLGTPTDIRMHVTQLKNNFYSYAKFSFTVIDVLQKLLLDKKNTTTINMSLLADVEKPKIKNMVDGTLIEQAIQLLFDEN
jgi:3-dehydroquinate synthase